MFYGVNIMYYCAVKTRRSEPWIVKKCESMRRAWEYKKSMKSVDTLCWRSDDYYQRNVFVKKVRD
jgi:hypothetical protein